MFLKIIVLKKFANFTGKHRIGVFFNKVAGPHNSNSIKKRPQHRFSPVKFKDTLFYRTSPVTTSDSFRFPAATLLKNRLQERYISVNFAILLRTCFDRTPPDGCFLCLSVNFEKLLRAPVL